MSNSEKVSSETLKYAVVVTGKPVMGRLGGYMSHKGDKFIICNGEWGVTSSRYPALLSEVPDDVKTFESEASATEYGLRWKGHPWWVDPLEFEVIEIKPAYKNKHCGWRKV